MRGKGGTWLALVVAAGLAVGAGVGSAEVRAGEPVAEVNGEAITAEELEQAVGPQLARIQEQIHTLRRQRVESLVAERLLAQEAKRQGLSVPALLDAEVTSKVAVVTEQEIARGVQALRGRRTKGDEAAVREQVRTRLQAQKLTAARQDYVRALRAQGEVVVNLAARPVFRVELATTDAPAKGPATAPVTIVEFSDFHCPFCKRVLPTLDQLRAVRRPGAARVARLSDRPAPSGGAPGPRGGAVRPRAGEVLGLPRRALRPGAPRLGEGPAGLRPAGGTGRRRL